MKRARRLVLPLCAALCGLAPAPPAGLEPLPDLGLERMDRSVRAQLGERLAELAATRSGALPAARQAEAWGTTGQLLLAYGLDEGAGACFRNAARLQPAAARWAYYAGVAAQEVGALDQAAASLAAALALAPDDPPALLRLGQVELARGRSQAAVAPLGRALAFPGTAAAAHLALGRLALDAGGAQEAADHFAAALALQPAASSVRHPLALAYRALGRLEEARGELARAGSAPLAFEDPLLAEAQAAVTGPGVHVLRGLAAEARGDLAAALAEYRRAVLLDPDNADLRQGLGLALAGAGDVAAAVAEYRAAVGLAPDNALARFNLAGGLLAAGAVEEARAELERAVALAPDFFAAHLELARLLAVAGDLAGAAARCARALQLDPESAPARRLCARIDAAGRTPQP